jgi:hypothetical protein
MVTHICDRCGKLIERDQLRYIAKIEVYAAADVLEISPEDLLCDHTEEMDRLLAQCERMSEDDLMQDVHVEMQFDLCRACQRAFLAAPLGNPSER